MSFKLAILKGADAFDARNRFDEGARKAYMNGSEAFTCLRKQWYAKNDAEQDGPQNWGFARRGSHAEIYMVERLRAANVPLLFALEEQVRIVDEDMRISCTPDGLADAQALGEKEEGWIGTEYKSIDPRTNLANLPKPEHIRQLQIGMTMFERHRDEFPELGGKPILYGKLVYINASDFNDIHEYRVPLKPAVLDQLKGRVNRLLDTKSAARLPREGKEAGGKECKQRCSFNAVCGTHGAGTSTGQGRKHSGVMSAQVDVYLLAGELIKSILQKEPDATVEGVQVKLAVVAGSVSYAKVVKEHLPNIDLEPYRGASSERLTIK